MELLFITLADFAQVINGKTYLMGGGWDTLTIPAQQAAGSHVAYVALAIAVGWAEMGKEHELGLELQQAGQRIGPIGSVKFTVPKPPSDVFLKHRTFMVALPVELRLSPGQFSVRLVVDRCEIGHVSYGVMAAGQPFAMPGQVSRFVGSS